MFVTRFRFNYLPLLCSVCSYAALYIISLNKQTFSLANMDFESTLSISSRIVRGFDLMEHLITSGLESIYVMKSSDIYHKILLFIKLMTLVSH